MNETVKYIINIVLVIAVVVLTVLLARSCTTHKEDVANIEALTDSIHTVEMKNGELLAYKAAYVMTKDELDRYTEFSKKEINELERKLKAKVDVITRVEGVITVDTIVMRDSVFISNDTIFNNFHYQDEWVLLDGVSRILDSSSETRLNLLQMDVPLTIGLTDDNKVFAKSANPYVAFTGVEGANIGKRKRNKYFNIGVQVGFGAMYNIRAVGDADPFAVGPYIGVGIAGGWDF